MQQCGVDNVDGQVGSHTGLPCSGSFSFSGVSRVLGLGLFPVLGWLKGITFVFDEDQRRILCSYSVEVRVAGALTEIGEREVG